MGRRRRRDPLEKRVSGLAGLVGLLIAACVFVPGVRSIFAGFLVMFLIGVSVVLIVLVGRAIYRHYFKDKDERYAAVYLAGKAGQTVSRGSIPNGTFGVRKIDTSGKVFPLPSANAADAKTGADVKAEPQSTASVGYEFWQDRLEGDKADSIPLHGQLTAFSQELLDALEWRRFEQLVTWYFQKTGFEAKRSRVGADGGVDIHVYKPGEDRPFAYVQCKAWYAYKVGVKPIRELFGVMAADSVNTGYFITTGSFTAEAQEFAKGRDMKLVTGGYLLEKLNSLSGSDRSELLYQVTAGDYTTPTCPRCDVKMVRRTGSDGDFWGCPNYSKRPRCRQTFKMRLT